MISAVIYILIGAFVGWNLPQPAWAAKTQEQILNFFRGTK
jgi:hypothetical protein